MNKEKKLQNDLIEIIKKHSDEISLQAAIFCLLDLAVHLAFRSLPKEGNVKDLLMNFMRIVIEIYQQEKK